MDRHTKPRGRQNQGSNKECAMSHRMIDVDKLFARLAEENRALREQDGGGAAKVGVCGG